MRQPPAKRTHVSGPNFNQQPLLQSPIGYGTQAAQESAPSPYKRGGLAARVRSLMPEFYEQLEQPKNFAPEPNFNERQRYMQPTNNRNFDRQQPQHQQQHQQHNQGGFVDRSYFEAGDMQQNTRSTFTDYIWCIDNRHCTAPFKSFIWCISKNEKGCSF